MITYQNLINESLLLKQLMTKVLWEIDVIATDHAPHTLEEKQQLI
jgi:dihydroorotase-like cyclic amidohydrolase